MTRREALAALIGMPVLGAQIPNSGTAYTIASGEVNAAEHEMSDGYYAIGVAGCAVMVKPESTGWLRLRELRGQKVDLLARVID